MKRLENGNIEVTEKELSDLIKRREELNALELAGLHNLEWYRYRHVEDFGEYIMGRLNDLGAEEDKDVDCFDLDFDMLSEEIVKNIQ